MTVSDRLAATNEIAAVARVPGSLELWCVGPDGSVNGAFWYENATWQHYQLSPPGSAATTSGIAAVARIPGSMELWYVGPDGFVDGNSWYENGRWQHYQLTQPHRPWAIILCRFQGETADTKRELPVANFFRGAFTPGSGGLVEYWRDASLGSVDVTGSRVFDWVEIDIPRIKAGGIGRSALIDAAIRASQSRGDDPVSGFHSQIAVYPHNWAKDGAPADADWRDPVWAPFWIDGSADSRGKVCLTPPFNGNITAHEMGHGFGMNHDVGPDLTTASDYSDPACIMSQNGPFLLAPWNVAFGPALCLPHLVEKNWLFPGRLYVDDGHWMSVGATIPLAPITHPEARANLGIRLTNTRAAPAWDYYLEYCTPTGWNQGVPGAPYLLIRRMVDIPGTGQRPAYLMALHFDQVAGAGATGVEPSGNVRFTAEVTNLPGPILHVTAEAL
jgi:hypothetical protein